MTNRHWIDLQVLYDSVLDKKKKKKKKVVFTVTYLGKNGLVGRDFFLSVLLLFSEMHILAVIMVHQHKICVYKGIRKLKLLIICENLLYFLRFNSFYFAL